MENSNNHSYSVNLRFHGENLDLIKVTKLLGKQPTECSTSNIASPYSSNSDPYWEYNGYDFPGYQLEWQSLEKGLTFVANGLRPVKSQIIDCSKIYNGIWWCGHFQSSFDGGPTFSPEFLVDLGSFGLPLYIDNYYVSG